MLDLSVRTRIEEAVREARPRGWRCSMRVVERDLLVLTLQQAPHDLLGMLVRMAQACGKSEALVQDLKIAHARGHCVPVWVPSAEEVERAAASLTPAMLEAGFALAHLHQAMRAPVVARGGRQEQAGVTFSATFQIGSPGKPFVYPARNRPDAVDASALAAWCAEATSHARGPAPHAWEAAEDAESESNDRPALRG